MKLFLISQSVNNNYDTYDSAVVCANTKKEARFIHPSGKKEWDGKFKEFDGWASAQEIKIEYLGEAKKSSIKGVICASFNAG